MISSGIDPPDSSSTTGLLLQHCCGIRTWKAQLGRQQADAQTGDRNHSATELHHNWNQFLTQVFFPVNTTNAETI
jgi:hypothetical protein